MYKNDSDLVFVKDYVSSNGGIFLTPIPLGYKNLNDSKAKDKSSDFDETQDEEEFIIQISENLFMFSKRTILFSRYFFADENGQFELTPLSSITKGLSTIVDNHSTFVGILRRFLLIGFKIVLSAEGSYSFFFIRAVENFHGALKGRLTALRSYRLFFIS